MQSFFNSIFGETLGPFGPLLIVGVLGIMLVAITVIMIAKQPQDPLDRLKQQQKAGAKLNGKDGKPQKVLRSQSKKTDKLQKYASFLEPQNDQAYSAARLKLIQAGYRSPNAVRIFHFAQFSLGLVLLLVGIIIAVIMSSKSDPSTNKLIMVVLGPGFAGYYLPKWWVDKRQKARITEIENGFPDALDLMLVCVEAGQSLDQSIIRVGKEIRAGFPALADEFDMVSFEIKAGKDKVNVLRDMSERAGVPDVASFVTVLIQSSTFGTSIAEALRVFSAEMRDKRVMRAEEKANTLPTKMTLVTMALTVPPLLVMLVGPSVYDIYELLLNNKF